MISRDGYAADTTEGGEVNYAAPTFKFSWENEPAKPQKEEKPAKPKRAKREDFQLQLF